jgi:hypothetical protein
MEGHEGNADAIRSRAATLPCDGRVMKPGEVLSPEQTAGLRRDNRDALVANHFIEIHTMSAELTK